MRTAHVDFSKKLRPWDGFGVNYVEVAQTATTSLTHRSTAGSAP